MKLKRLDYDWTGHKELLMVKFADGGNKRKTQYQSLPWLSAQDADVSDSLLLQ